MIRRTFGWQPSARPGPAGPIRLLAACILALGSAGAQATTYTVTNIADSGAGSLRQAVLDANAHAGTDTIAFAIPGSGVHTINVPTALATFSSPVILDGATQPGYAGSPLIELHGSLTPGILITAGGSTVRGLVLNGFSVGIRLQTGGGNHVEGCYVGTDKTGAVGATTGSGIEMFSSNSNTIGGTSPSSRNLISGNSGGILVQTSDGAIIQGNLIGTDLSGTTALPNGYGISLSQANNALIGGSAAGARNVVSGNLGTAIDVVYGSGHVIQGNFIGTDITGTKALGSPTGINMTGTDTLAVGGSGPGEGNLISANGVGIYIYNNSILTVFGNLIGTDVTGNLPLGNVTGVLSGNNVGGAQVGGTGPGEGNVIAFSTGSLAFSVPAGVVMTSSNQIPIRGNSIHDNKQLGIDLNGNGPTPNDPGDADTGPNNLQNFPIVRSVTHLGPTASGSTKITGKLDSAASTTYTLDFYANPACSPFPRELLEGETYLGSAPATTNGAGHANFDVTLPVSTPAGARISVTATDPLGNTSEFSQRIIFSIDTPSGPASGGRPITVNGTDFADPVTMTIGGVSTPNTFVNDHTLFSASPSLAAGTVNDVVVTTPDGTTGTLVKGWVADFLDVPEGHQFHSFVTTLVSNAITVGVAPGLYGVAQPTLRQQMAVFLLKAKYGICYAPPPCITPVFTDVPCSSTFAPWINELVAEGITGGCGPNVYCPTNPVLRQQMAVLLLKTFEGPGYAPSACSVATFTDVPCSSNFAPWIYELVARQITAGCGVGTYCPLTSANRGQMATFLVKAFKLQ